MERVLEVHLAGGSFKEGMLVDTHANPVRTEVWDLLDYVCQRAPIEGVVIERDANLPPIRELLDEVETARRILRRRGCLAAAA